MRDFVRNMDDLVIGTSEIKKLAECAYSFIYQLLCCEERLVDMVTYFVSKYCFQRPTAALGEPRHIIRYTMSKETVDVIVEMEKTKKTSDWALSLGSFPLASHGLPLSFRRTSGAPFS
ncbi:hypothetical protein TvY486_0045840 [Trypanosoma vivax Y486]|uniref:Uncharacterized protein n=1 Tax=Trypanosoma vivax (strain Y486) TaxID=1055687 RepID=F9WVQ5_TRYVY|nr:hypothetical protein TvY486_0045840 [Trypanosoma vivax Y486]|eukprot:CCD21663.1 hypothetical protein TvY486_0045840 [Trypanosoma vivax Y486]